MNKIWAWIKAKWPPMWKAIMPLIVGLGFTIAIQLVEGLETTVGDSPMIMAVITAIAVWLKANRPVITPSPEPTSLEEGTG